jgi:hypothetical protein
MKLENLDIAEYKNNILRLFGWEKFKYGVITDLEKRLPVTVGIEYLDNKTITSKKKRLEYQPKEE